MLNQRIAHIFNGRAHKSPLSRFTALTLTNTFSIKLVVRFAIDIRAQQCPLFMHALTLT